MIEEVKTKYILVKGTKVVNVVIADEDFIEHIRPQYDHIELIDTEEEGKVTGPGWNFDPVTKTFSQPVEELKGPDPTWKITKLAFKNRFPKSKWISAKQESLTNPILADFFETFDLATHIDLKREDTIADVTSLGNEQFPESFRLTQEEINNVLNVPAGDDEHP